MQPKKILIAPDSFKGTLSSAQICEIIAKAAHNRFPGCKIVSIPIADGGEGSVDSFLACAGGEKRWVTVKGPFMEDMKAFYAVLSNGCAVIEMAACAGLPLVGDNKNPFTASTYGVGQLILDAVNRGAKKIILGLGGSATNDGGCGAAAACGVQFIGVDGQNFIPTGGTLKDIQSIDLASLPANLSGIEITAMCDINNPMHGTQGAAYIFGPQKGANADDVIILDNGLKHLEEGIKQCIGKDVANIPGAGAAGAMGAGMLAFFNATLKMGIEVVLDTVGFDSLLDDADLVITGEGSFDHQSLGGKAVMGIARRAKEKSTPVIVISGGAEELDQAYDMGVTAVFTINRRPEDLSVSKGKSAENLRATVDNVFRLIGGV
ncbi:MAG: glycerate kinase [Defluviitaleaceae bacterium]|nr:glycerate kinase [Defluviitaleaceae bacterium]